MSLSRRKFLALSGVAAGAHSLNISTFAQAAGGRSNQATFYWPSNRALPVFPEAYHLDSADITALDADHQGVLVSLQGIVNRTRPRLYLYWGTDPTNAEWLKSVDVPSTTASDPWSLVDRYRSEINGAIVYDPNVPDTINLATTLAGMHGAVIATADLAKSLQLRVIEDLTGRFTDKFSVYNYALANVWPRTTKRLMAAIGPSNTQAVANVQWTTLLKVSAPITDGSNKQAYPMDLSAFASDAAVYVKFQDAYTSDGWGPSVSQVTLTADGATIASFQPGSPGEAPFLFDADSSQVASGGWRFADGTNYFIYKFTPPAGTRQLTLTATMWNEYFVTATATQPSIQVVNPLFRDYIVATSAPVFWLDPDVAEEAALFAKILATFDPDAPYLGWFPNGDEMPGVTLCGQHSSPVVAADVFYNGSAFSGIRAPIRPYQPPAKTPQLKNKIYISFTMVEGDNIQYDQHRMRQMWDDPARGQVPLGWSVSVLLMDIAPAMLSYFQQTQTENDLLVAGPSGAGYTYPDVWPSSTLPGFMKRSGAYMQQTGMHSLFVYNRNGSTDVALSAELVQLYKQNAPGLQGIVYNFETTSQTSIIAGVPVSTLLGVNDLASGVTELAAIAAAWNGTSPLFIAAGLESWNMMPADAVSLANQMGSDFELVRPDVFFNLVRMANAKS
ncbi:GxGYxYP domain-containing protein [Silvibacterium acidisoli]|uniref:GxGYxYP domain-containing protein n=1 Tax=Acidobacteriaceae bacterium ZG23-2 TaxID=2883246 RepID=UPI00406C1A6A